LAGQNSVMPVIVRTSDSPYRWTVEAASLDKIANHEKIMPAGFIRKDSSGITAAARRYLQPLIAGEAFPPFGREGLPVYVQLDRATIRRTLPRWEG
jgi:6-phosphofructokinase 1